MMKKLQILIMILWIPAALTAQEFYFGTDLSSANQLEDCGAVFKEAGQPKDVFQIFAERGTNLMRVRLWVDPSWWQSELQQPAGVKPFYNDLEDVKKTISRAKAQGMQIMLGIHYSDFWADPQHQLIPRAWLDDAYNVPALAARVYDYTVSVLEELDSEGLMPDLVKVGNENNAGILSQIPAASPSFETAVEVATWEDWDRHAQLFNAAIQGVRDVGAQASKNPKIVIHFTGTLNGQEWNYNNLITNGVTDFDIMGISYYVSWHGGTISELQSTLQTMKSTWPQYDVMVAETGYLWSKQNYDGCANIVTTGDKSYNPVSPENQLAYMVDYTQAVINAGGVGVVFWEPAWVSTPCSTPWCVGSSHDHLAFFDPVDTNVMENGAINWTMASNYTFPNINQSPIANAGTDQTLLDNDGDGSEQVTLNAGNSSDPDGTIVSYEWKENGVVIATGINPTLSLNIGSHNIELVVVDNEGAFSSDNVLIVISSSSTNTPNVTFRVDMTGQNVNKGVFVVGDMTNWTFQPMTHIGNKIYEVTIQMAEGDQGAYYFIRNNNWANSQNYRETVPAECAIWWGTDRGYDIPNYDVTYAYVFGSCQTIGSTYFSKTMSSKEGGFELKNVFIYPNPTNDILEIKLGKNMFVNEVSLLDITGRVVLRTSLKVEKSTQLDLSRINSGTYFLILNTNNGKLNKKIIKK